MIMILIVIAKDNV